MLSFVDMTTFKQLLMGAYPRNSRPARWDRRVLMGVINLALFAAVAGMVIEGLDLHFSWRITNVDPLHITLSREHWATLALNPDVVAPGLKENLPRDLEPWNLSVVARIAHLDPGARVLSLLSSVPMNLLLVVVIWFVRSIVRTTIGTDECDGDPFIAANVRRLRIIAAILLAAHLVDAGARIADSEVLSRTVPKLPPATTVLELNVNAMLIYFGVGILMLVLAEVFKAGVQLRQDTEGLV